MYPTNIPSYPDTQGGETLGNAGSGKGLSQILDDYGADITAIATKVGSSASVAALNKVLVGTGAGTSAWSSTLAGLTLTSPTINSPSINSPTIVTPSVDTINESTPANGVSVDGLNIKDGKLNTNNSVITTNITDKNVTAAKIEDQQAWQVPTLLNSWVNFGSGYETAGYMKDSLGFVHIKGFIKNGTTVLGTVIFNLPAGYRPGGIQRYATHANNTYGAIEVDTAGQVMAIVANAAHTSINCSFRAEN